MCLVVHGLPHVYKEAVLPQRMDNQVLGLFSLLSFSQQGLYSTSLITASGFVINNSQGLNHFDYIIEVCSYYIIRLISA